MGLALGLQRALLQAEWPQALQESQHCPTVYALPPRELQACAP